MKQRDSKVIYRQWIIIKLRGKRMDVLYVDTLTYAQGNMYIVASDEGLVYIGTPNAPFEEVEVWAKNI